MMRIHDILTPSWRNALRIGGTVSVILTAIATTASVQAQTKIRLTLDWVPQATHGPTFIAQYEGYFKAEGLDVKIDAGKGSAEAVRRLVAGTHDIGWPDINALIQFNAKNPDKTIKTVMMLYEQPPFSICVLAKSEHHESQAAGWQDSWCAGIRRELQAVSGLCQGHRNRCERRRQEKTWIHGFANPCCCGVRLIRSQDTSSRRSLP